MPLALLKRPTSKCECVAAAAINTLMKQYSEGKRFHSDSNTSSKRNSACRSPLGSRTFSLCPSIVSLTLSGSRRRWQMEVCGLCFPASYFLFSVLFCLVYLMGRSVVPQPWPHRSADWQWWRVATGHQCLYQPLMPSVRPFHREEDKAEWGIAGQH